VEILRMAVEFLPGAKLKPFLCDDETYDPKTNRNRCLLERIYEEKRFALVDALDAAVDAAMDKTWHLKVGHVLGNMKKSLAPFRPGAMKAYSQLAMT